MIMSFPKNLSPVDQLATREIENGSRSYRVTTTAGGTTWFNSHHNQHTSPTIEAGLSLGDMDAVPSLECGLAPDQQTIARYRLSLAREVCVPYDEPIYCDQPQKAAGFLHRILATYDREVLGALLVGANHRAIGHTLAYIGTLTQAPAEPRGLLVPALLANAAAVILFHNHPSGDPKPSADDIALTSKVAAAGDILGIQVLDHLVLGDPPSYVSLWQKYPW